MGYQWIHANVYGRVAGKGKEGGHSIRSIIAEANRETGAHPHVKEPAPPVLLFGAPLLEVEAQATAWAEQAKDARNHKLRKDGICLMSGTVSAPDEMSAETWEAMKQDAIAWLNRDGRLVSVVEHTDEKYRHIHFYKIPAPGARFESIHEGRAALQAAKDKGLTKIERDHAYNEAMRGWQDDFYAEVGAKHGLTRLGPARRRLTRSEWVAEQAASAALARTIKQAEQAKAEAAALLASVETETQAKAEELRLAEAKLVEAVEEAKARAAKAKEEADKATKAQKEAAKATTLKKREVLAVIRERAAMERVRDELSAERKAFERMRHRGDSLGQLWASFVGALKGEKAKAAKQKRDSAAELKEARAETKKEREAKEALEAGKKRLELQLAVDAKTHREQLAEAEAERERAEKALAAFLQAKDPKRDLRF